MIKHIVCYKLKDPSPETLAKMKELFLSMRGRVPELKEVTAGIDALKSPRSYDVVLEAKFRSFEDMAAYKKNEYHVSVVQKFVHSVIEKSVSVDYEC